VFAWTKIPDNAQNNSQKNEGGHTFHNTITNVRLDNQCVATYNPYLLLKYNCHINVEICNSISSVKYLYKYVYKGDDNANVAIFASSNDFPDINVNRQEENIINIDEIKIYTTGRYIGACNAMWENIWLRNGRKRS